jgi:hypothetical protein
MLEVSAKTIVPIPTNNTAVILIEQSAARIQQVSIAILRASKRYEQQIPKGVKVG